MPKVREASHAGSWYTDDGRQLQRQLDKWLDQVPSSIRPIGTMSSQEGEFSPPVPNARAIIAPHAGYAYSGPAAAWAYKSADWANVKRVFLLGPSHHHYLPTAATTACEKYETPLGDLIVDVDLVQKIKKEWNLDTMNLKTDEDEHSLEMHLPYIHRMLSLQNTSFQQNPASVPLIPIMVGATTPKTERDLGARLAPYLTDPSNIFVISSDFCHWGSRFSYTYYQPRSGATTAVQLRSSTSSSDLKDYPIHASIKAVDFESMDAIESGVHDEFVRQLERTGNTVCGRHPIGVFMAAVESAGLLGEGKGRFRFVRYERSSEVVSVKDSSVSYASAFAVL
ncbi:UPF0103-domain-containing protein [Periconia macrospinosa]|uniref:UPF0103-domain-containing protein n=1 Tax=Periconia macrospinosa TaxID=97972 RepID=A0A2V1DYP5_9PLEO|nr:UPF0103-domain-containing protein [Periconia macrospinosa]